MSSAIPSSSRTLLAVIAVLPFFILLFSVNDAFPSSCGPCDIIYDWLEEIGVDPDTLDMHTYCGDVVADCAAAKGSSCSVGSIERDGYSYQRAYYEDSSGNHQYFACGPGSPGDTCADERAALEQQCGGSDTYTILDEETCDGRCNDCIEDAATECDGEEHVVWNSDGECSYDCDSDGDGIPDDEDPCPDNSDPECEDSDDDGIPDDEDPCPDNPDPECGEPEIPEPEIPDTITIGDCVVDVSGLKAWLLSDDSFPFNFIYRLYQILSPLFDSEPQAPVIRIDFSLDPSSRNPYLPDVIPIDIDFGFLDDIVSFVRKFLTISIYALFALYGVKRMRSFSGVGA